MSELQVDARLRRVDGEPSPWQLETHEISPEQAIQDDEMQAAEASGREMTLRPDVNEDAREPLHVSQARHIARALFDHWGVSDALSGSAELVISEILANATEHGDGIAELDVQWARAKVVGSHVLELLRIEVVNKVDTEPTTPRVESTLPDDDAENGRGLPIVDALTDGRWGQELRQRDDAPVMVTHATLREKTEPSVKVAA